MPEKTANILIEAWPFIRQFAGQTVVIKYGGHAMVDEQLKADFAKDITLMKYVGLNPVVVHGGGPQINQVMDRMGIRPLHYVEKDKSLFFASEIKSLFACRSISRDIDPIAIDQIFTFWTTLPGTSVFKGIRELRPGHYLKTQNGRMVVKKY